MSNIDDYLAARAAFVTADDGISALARSLQAVAENLEHHRHSFSFTDTGVNFPADVVFKQYARNFSGNRWPAAKQINEALVAWHIARTNVMKTWDAIDRTLQGGLHPPPDRARNRF